MLLGTYFGRFRKNEITILFSVELSHSVDDTNLGDDVSLLFVGDDIFLVDAVDVVIKWLFLLAFLLLVVAEVVLQLLRLEVVVVLVVAAVAELLLGLVGAALWNTIAKPDGDGCSSAPCTALQRRNIVRPMTSFRILMVVLRFFWF